jgi:predicted GIY-YIG superfamily endonuclease
MTDGGGAPLNETTALYTLFGYSVEGKSQPLYHGTTSDIAARIRQHSQRKPWWPLVRCIAWSWHDTRDEAETLEKFLIRYSEAALFNKAGRKLPPRSSADLYARVAQSLLVMGDEPTDYDHPLAVLARQDREDYT